MNYYNVYAYVIYLMFIIVLLILDGYILKKKLNQNYILEILILLISMVIFSNEYVAIFTVIIALFAIAIYLLLKRINEKSKKNIRTTKKNTDIPIGFFLCSSYIIVIIISNFICNYKLV